jgi:hypothetical protein
LAECLLVNVVGHLASKFRDSPHHVNPHPDTTLRF